MSESDALLKGLEAIRQRAKSVMLDCDPIAKLIEEGDARDTCSSLTCDAEVLLREVKALRVAVGNQFRKLVHVLNKEADEDA